MLDCRVQGDAQWKGISELVTACKLQNNHLLGDIPSHLNGGALVLGLRYGKDPTACHLGTELPLLLIA